MAPTLQPNTSILVSPIPYFFVTPKVGDIIALKTKNSQKTLIKRIAKIEQDKYFVAGDNENDSLDSRSLGWITKKDILGKIISAFPNPNPRSRILKNKT